MGKYVVTEGQNLYDIALHLTGSIEGIVDLLICNPVLSLADTLRGGDELFYTDDFVINADVVARYRREQIVPHNLSNTVSTTRSLCPDRYACTEILPFKAST